MVMQDGDNDNRKVELVINRPIEEENEISLLEVFKDMGSAKAVFLRLVCLCLIAGMVFSMVGAYIKKDSGRVKATLEVLYEEPLEEGEEEKTSEDVSFNSYVLSTAISRSGLSGTLTAASLSDNIVIERLLTEECRQALELIQSGIASGKNSSAELLNFDYEYSNKYVITINNGFGRENEKKQNLTGKQMTALLNNILNVYAEKLYEDKADRTLPPKNLENIDFGSLDYIQIINVLNESLDGFIDYCEKKADEYPDYRSAMSGMTFSELEEYTEYIKAHYTDALFTYICSNKIAKNPSELLSSLNYSLRTKTVQLGNLDSKIADNASVISKYQKETIVVSLGDETQVEAASNSDYYNELFLEQAELFKERALVSAEIARLNDEIEIFSEVKSGASYDELEEQIAKSVEKIRATEDYIYDTAKAFTESDTIKTSFVSSSSAVYSEAGFINAGTLKKAAVAGLVGAFLAVCVWGVWAIIVEMKKGEKHENL